MARKRKDQRTSEPAQPVLLEKLLSVNDVAGLLNIGRTKVYGLINDDGLPTVQVGGVKRINPVDLKEWIASRTCKVAS